MYADNGDVDVLRREDGEAIHRRCSEAHHHHLVCRSCGATVEVEGPTVERWTTAMAADHGFTDVSHTLEIFGTCADMFLTRVGADRPSKHAESAYFGVEVSAVRTG